MKGAVQGLATTTASTPVKKSPAAPDFSVSACPVPASVAPNCQSPDRLRPIANSSNTNTATTAGCCNWKPQPSASPAPRKASTSAPATAKLASTPAVYQSACDFARARLVPPSASDKALNESTGSTQGIRFRIRPPTRASSIAANKPVSVAGLSSIFAAVRA